MGATAEDSCQLAVLDRLAVLRDIDEDLQAVITRIANRALTDAEGDDVAQLIEIRGHVRRYGELVARCHKDCREDKPTGPATQPYEVTKSRRKGNTR